MMRHSRQFLVALVSLASFAICILSIHPFAYAQVRTQVLPPFNMALQPNDRIEIRGFRGVVDYEVNANSNEVSVTSSQTIQPTWANQEEWQFVMRRESGRIMILVEGPTDKKSWQEAYITRQVPVFALKISGPSVPLQINWSEGQVNVNNMGANLDITTISGEVSVRGGEGDLSVSNSSGRIFVAGRKGAVKINTYRAKTEVENIEGSLNIENFAGDTLVQNINGSVQLGSHSGQHRLAQLKGKLQFENGNATLHIEKFEGELRGKTEQGPVFADIRGEANVRLVASQGSVSLKMPSSAAWVNLGTEDGSLYVPSFLKLTRLATQQIRTGRLRNGGNGGSVFVRTGSGNIRVR